MPSCSPFWILSDASSLSKDTTRRSTALTSSSVSDGEPSAGVVSRLSIMGSTATPPAALHNHRELCSSSKALPALFFWSCAVSTVKTLGPYIAPGSDETCQFRKGSTAIPRNNHGLCTYHPGIASLMGGPYLSSGAKVGWAIPPMPHYWL